MSKPIDQEDIDKLHQLTETLQSLNLATAAVTRRRNELIRRNSNRNNKRSGKALRKQRRKNEFRVGDLVEVKDKYKGRQGIKGIVTEVYMAQVFLAPIDGTTGFRKYKENIKLLEENCQAP